MMDLQAFAKHTTAQVAAFERYWTQQHRKEPERYPLDLTVNTWRKAFETWIRDGARDA